MTLFKYILKELLPNFIVGLIILVFISLMGEMLPITELMITHGVHFSQILSLILYLMPGILVFALPAVVLISSVVTFLRFSSDNEIIALKSSGISLYQMMPPVALFSGFCFVFTILMSCYAVSWGNRSFKNVIFQIAESKADLGIKARVFSEPFDNVVFYVSEFDEKDWVMKDVFVMDSRDNLYTNTIVAKEARIFRHPAERMITLRFSRGTILVVDKSLESSRNISFKTYDLHIGMKDIMDALASRQKAPKEMSMKDLLDYAGELKRGDTERNEMMIEFFERISLPIGVFFMGLIGVPLGAQLRSRERSVGIGVSLIVFTFYYMCLAGTRSLCEPGVIPPEVGVWMPDVFLIGAYATITRRAANEKTIGFPRIRIRKPKTV
jgi:lipopolysaccharide export system permease protein